MDMTDPSAAGAPSTGAAPPSAPGGAGEPPETITITPDGSGGWSVEDGDSDPPVACKSLGDVMKAVHDMLSGTDDADDAKSAWADEASKRPGPDGAPSGAPQMTMP